MGDMSLTAFLRCLSISLVLSAVTVGVIRWLGGASEIAAGAGVTVMALVLIIGTPDEE